MLTLETLFEMTAILNLQVAQEVVPSLSCGQVSDLASWNRQECLFCFIF
jgi:hypothetical protein